MLLCPASHLYPIACLLAATVFWIPLRTYQYIVRSHQHQTGTPSPLADLALSLLLILAHYPAHHAQLTNGVKESLHHLRDVTPAGDSEAGTGRFSSPGPTGQNTAAVSFAQLYKFFATGECCMCAYFRVISSAVSCQVIV